MRPTRTVFILLLIAAALIAGPTALTTPAPANRGWITPVGDSFDPASGPFAMAAAPAGG